ncbi:beta-1,4-N-acetylgalactosaminyltransferase bre-4-like isoform X2 [Crassostrea angulata]|uniref:beta-1,4-N-acetylgalactosaminyltransferase bre-4-like isoform X2 n=1 Tax=Magallana angulata TaxID=2784310 RepID=UPI00148ADF69|nr:beta-1,4-N-acetylgalactosaminyltransferase bre-4 isoform X4 [Crassostrea gigas]XP_052704995.1 beta-1,4-N-acetylgalactosaminyltransferase bre-4-like isoform X2 [Crassostrea angulata]
MQNERYIWTLFVTVLGLSFLVFCSNLTLLTSKQEEDNNICQKYPKNLVGTIYPNLTDTSYKDMEFRFTWVQTGGHHTPTRCKPRERADEKPFNRGKLFNIGYLEAKKDNHTCFVFHDVDLIPENDHILYGCVRSPMHLSRAVNKFNYKLPYKELLGGVAAWKTKEFEQVNGWSNLFVNWGGEDDDLSYRTIANKLSIFRFRNSVARYTMLEHRRTPVNTARHRQLKDSYTRYKIDGLSSLVYESPRIQRYNLFTMVSINT